MIAKTLLMLTITTFASTGCFHAPHKIYGQENKSGIPEGYKVAIGSTEVKEGDKVNVFSSTCEKRPSKREIKDVCVDRKIGEALVLRVFDHDAAIVRPDQGVPMEQAKHVEKQ